MPSLAAHIGMLVWPWAVCIHVMLHTCLQTYMFEDSFSFMVLAQKFSSVCIFTDKIYANSH